MTFERRILHLPESPDADGTLIADRAVQGCWFELHRRGGCGAGELVLNDDFLNRDQIRIDDWIVMESAPGERWYLGRVEQRRAVSPAGITIRLEGMSAELAEVYAGGFARSVADGIPPHRFGQSNLFPDDPDAFDETVDSAGAPEFTVQQLLDRYVEGRTHITIDPARIEPAPVGHVQSMKLRGEESIRSVIKELAVRAGQASWGVDAAGTFFFLQPRTTAVAEYTEAVDTIRLEEITNRELLFNRITLTGDYVYRPVSGLTGQYHISRWRGHYLHAASRAKYGDRRLRIWVPWIRTRDDSRAFVQQLFQDHAEPQPHYTVEVAAQSVLPVPWEGSVRLVDREGSEICNTRCETIRVQFDRSPRFRLELGPEDPRIHWPEPEHDERWEIPRNRASGEGGDEITDDTTSDSDDSSSSSHIGGTTTSQSSGASSDFSTDASSDVSSDMSSTPSGATTSSASSTNVSSGESTALSTAATSSSDSQFASSSLSGNTSSETSSVPISGSTGSSESTGTSDLSSDGSLAASSSDVGSSSAVSSSEEVSSKSDAPSSLLVTSSDTGHTISHSGLSGGTESNTSETTTGSASGGGSTSAGNTSGGNTSGGSTSGGSTSGGNTSGGSNSDAGHTISHSGLG